MQTTAVRFYGENDIRLEKFELPEVGRDNILARVISDSVCMSTWKTVQQGSAHKRVPDTINQSPVIIGHELCGVIIEVGEKWQHKYKKGDKFAIQPVLDPNGSYDTIGYSFPTVGGDSEFILLTDRIISCGCILPYSGNNFFGGSLAEPLSCIVGGFRAAYHNGKEEYTHEMGLKSNGNMAIIGGAGPMGLGAIDLALNGDKRPGLLVVTDINRERLERAEKLFPPAAAAQKGITLHFINTKEGNAVCEMKKITENKGFDDILCMAPVQNAIAMADELLARDGCLNFFAGPLDQKFSASFNFYNVHYSSTHVVGTSGGTTNDLRIALKLLDEQRLHPEVMITHIGGLDAAVDTTLHLPDIPGGKKIIYPGIRMPLTAITDFGKLASKDPLFAKLATACEKNNNLWNSEAETLLLQHFDILK